MLPKLLNNFIGFQGVRGFTKQIHTQMCLNALFDQRRKIENEWNDDEDEQRRVFHEEEKTNVKGQEKKQLKCEITGKPKQFGSFDCSCSGMCMTRLSETHLIHYEGGVGIIPKK